MLLVDILDTHRLLCFSRWSPAKFTAHSDLGATRDVPASVSLKIYYLQQKRVPDFFKELVMMMCAQLSAKNDYVLSQ